MFRYYECSQCGGTIPFLELAERHLSSSHKQVLVIPRPYCQCDGEFPGWAMELKAADARP